MYPRNSTSPERIDIGAVVQISDGAVQTSGCTVRIIPAGGAEGDGAGTTAYSDDGVVLYTPTQAETNYTSFILIAKKAGCIPASKTVVTSANATAGKVTVGTNEDKTGYTASTVSDKTGYSLAAGHGLATEAKQDSILGYVDCLPATWVVPAAAGAAMTLTAAYDAAKTAAQAGNAMALTSGERTTLAAATRDAILNRVLNGNHDTAGTPGKLLQNADAPISDVPTVAEFEARTVPAASIATSTQTAAILDAVGVVDTVADAIKAKTDGLNFTGTDVKATLDGEEVTPTAASKTGYSLATAPPTAVQIRQEIDSNSTQLALLAKLAQADLVIDTDVSPWALVWIEKDTGALGVGTELLRQTLRDVNGDPITATTTVIGQVGM